MTGGLEEIEFVDLILGATYADIRVEASTGALRSLPESHAEELKELREMCAQAWRNAGEPEFSIRCRGVLYRVTAMNTLDVESVVFFLSRPSRVVLSFDDIPLPTAVRALALNPAAKGLILVAGAMSSGKTSTCASWVKSNLDMHGGQGLVIQDPIETYLEGVHGNGRAHSIVVSQKTGSYEDVLRRSLRARAHLVFIGEIRDAITAHVVLHHSNTNTRVASTIHAGSIVGALKQVTSWAAARSSVAEARDALASGIVAVIFQRLEQDGSNGNLKRLVVEGFAITGTDKEKLIRNKIRSGLFDELEADINSQRRALWA